MNDNKHEQVNDFLGKLGEALKDSASQRAEILDEVRTDLDEHIMRFQEEGCSEDEAVTAALAEMGNPYELAHDIRREIPPFGGPAVTTIRYIAASGIMLWLALLAWGIRAWTNGAEGTGALLAVILFHLPIILFLWPRIVWRRNWLFGLIPAGLAFLVVVLLSVAARQTELQYTFPETEQEVAALQLVNQETAEQFATYGILLLVTLAVITVILLLAMQQRSQRRRAVLALVVALAVVEVPYQVEELVFRQDRDQVRAYLEATRKETGSWPTDDEIRNHGPRMRGKNPHVSVTPDDYWIYWSRPLRSGFALHYSSQDNRVRVQD